MPRVLGVEEMGDGKSGGGGMLRVEGREGGC